MGAATRAYGWPSAWWDDSGGQDGGLLGLQMLNAYERAHAGAEGLEGNAIRYGGTGSARTSEIDRSLDGDMDSSGGSEYEAGASTASEGGMDVGSGYGDAFSDMEW